MTGATATLAAYAAGLRYEDLPPEVAERAKHLAVDFIGSIVRARTAADSSPSLFASLRAMGLDRSGPSTLLGTSSRYAQPVAALLNGALGHSLDFDDTHADSSLHPSAPVVSAAFAVGEATGASGADLLAAIVAGIEVCCRLGNALDPTEHYARGFHPTATAGTFGAAAAAGRLYGLDAARMANAFGVAGSQAAGSLQFLGNGGWNKRYQVGAAAMNGVIAATLANNDFHAAGEALEGKHGFLAGYSGKPRMERATAGLGSIYETMRIGVKPYPSCRYSHAAIDGLIALRGEGLDAANVTRIVVGLHRNGVTLVGDPIEEKRRPSSVVGGQFSMPFTGAVALMTGAFGWDDYERLGDAQVGALAERVDVVRDERLEGREHPFGAILTVETADGMIEREIADPSGEPATFPTVEAMREKFIALAGPVLDDAAAYFDALMAMESARDLTALFTPGAARLAAE